MINKGTIYMKSEELIERKIENEHILIPFTSKKGKARNDLYTFNEVGLEIWKRINGKNNVGEIITELYEIFDVEKDVLSKSVHGFIKTLIKSGLIEPKK